MSEPRVLIVGASGQVGRALQHSFAGHAQVIATDHKTLDLTVPDRIRDVVRQVRLDVILNAAAYTGDRAESEPELAMVVNAHAPEVLAEEALLCNAILVHYSTDYVFDGAKQGPWTESDAPNPLNTYGDTKLAGEEAIRQVGGRYLIFRTSWVYGPHGKNFLNTMLRLGRERDRLSIVDDQFGAPTTSLELARATHLVLKGIGSDRFRPPEVWSGVYHMTCSGSITWYGFARAIFDRTAHLLSGHPLEVVPALSCDYPTAAKRPRNSALSNERLQQRFGIHLAPWETALNQVIAKLPA